jgi:hypothetical protein
MRLAPAVLLVLCALGCSSNNLGKLENSSWSSDPTTYKGRAIPEGFLKIEFKDSGQLVYRAGPNTFTGTYSLGPGNSVLFHLDKELGGHKVHSESVAVHGSHMKVCDSDGTEVTFRKRR